MTTTPNLVLPYLAAGQAQKHVTLNESLRMLDALVQLAVLSRVLAAALQHGPASWIAQIQAAGTRSLRARHGRTGSCANQSSFAARAGGEAVNALTSQPDHSVGADQAMVFVSNESGGAVLAFSDGANWRRVTDRVVVS